MNKDIIEYIKNESKRGVSEEDIRKNLSKRGWKIEDIDDAFRYVATSYDDSELVPAPESSAVFPGPISLLREMFGVYKDKWRTLTGLFLVFIALMAAISIMASLATMYGYNQSTSAVSTIAIITLAITALFILFAYPWIMSSAIYAIKDDIGFKESYKKGWHRILPFLLTFILLILVELSGYILVIIPGIIFSVWFGFSFFVLISENEGALNSLIKSKEYVKKHWWGVFGRFLFFSLLVIIVFMLVRWISCIYPPQQNMIYSILEIITKIIVLPLSIIYSFLMYSHLKELKGEEIAITKNQRRNTVIFIIVVVVLAVGLCTYLGILADRYINNYINNYNAINTLEKQIQEQNLNTAASSSATTAASSSAAQCASGQTSNNGTCIYNLK